MRQHRCAALIAVPLVLLLVAGCQPTSAPVPEDPRTTRVEVAFRDSSVPPEYHRSWRLTLDHDEIRGVVDSYGDVVAKQTATMPAKRWRRFVAGLEESVERIGDAEEPEEGCAGGTGMTLTITGEDGADVTVDVENCNTEDNERVMDDIEELVRPFSERVHLEQLKRTPWPAQPLAR